LAIAAGGLQAMSRRKSLSAPLQFSPACRVVHFAIGNAAFAKIPSADMLSTAIILLHLYSKTMQKNNAR
jgi:uncharacterized membrane protein